jgi:peptidylprolyl isomerase
MRRRRLLVLVLAAILAAGVAACGGDDNGGAAADTTSTTAQGPQKSVRDVNILDPKNLTEKPSIAVPDGKPPTTLQQLDLVTGTGRTAHEGDKVSVQYVGVAWSTGEEFDASWDRNQAFDFTLGKGDVIQGWDKGVAGMKVGGRRVLVIPPGLAYGAQGSQPAIGPNETLVFVVDLKKVTPASG